MSNGPECYIENMRKIFEHRGLRLIFVANMISMLGSGLNAAAVTWYILRKTGSEEFLAYLVVFQTLPAVFLLPFSGVVIDREDRRRLVMWLDGGRGLIILGVAMLVLFGKVHLWHLYVMGTLVAIGFWMFWPTITALIQELTPESEYVHSNTFLMAGVQGGWLIAGSIVGFLYNHIGLGPILLIDVATYAVSFTCYLFVRKGRVVVERPQAVQTGGEIAKYFHELKEGVQYVLHRPAVIALGASWALFLGGMLTQGVVTAPLSDRILHTGAVGYGWLNGAWGVGAFLSATYAAAFIQRFTGRVTLAIGMAAMAAGMYLSPYSHIIQLAVVLFAAMGSARGLVGIALGSSMMEMVPKFIIGRTQNVFYFAGMILQIALSLAVGFLAHRVSLTWAYILIAINYTAAVFLALSAAHAPKAEPETIAT